MKFKTQRLRELARKFDVRLPSMPDEVDIAEFEKYVNILCKALHKEEIPIDVNFSYDELEKYLHG